MDAIESFLQELYYIKRTNLISGSEQIQSDLIPIVPLNSALLGAGQYLLAFFLHT
jgi:hypothetical protein